jgi:hypothetical protein
MLNVVMLNVFMLSVIMLNVYAECRHTECLYAECRCAECRGALVNIALALHKSILCITAFHLKARIYLSDLIVQFWQL